MCVGVVYSTSRAETGESALWRLFRRQIESRSSPAKVFSAQPWTTPSPILLPVRSSHHAQVTGEKTDKTGQYDRIG